ncbi:TlpA disulfide reductase family protein [Paenibacillus eucommiae]|uniref:Thiol-disulfide isomerase/thioredoxin n=1 Tax=Paenibacillus eucommiae TaxID=1355755 RepID=A0ABS4J042_9BACL|nr:TlpA disulfide reductase family protein [Paenibacillus eucommiae]MBP1992144.1 thiol-disulfide isomerase/thioredoxin [Paenibacillus eucommiae]
MNNEDRSEEAVCYLTFFKNRLFKKEGVILHTINVGPLVLNFELVIFILSAFMGYWALRYRLKMAAVEAKTGDKFVSALILGFFTWKFSLIIFDPASIIAYPMSLLYFSGGERGLWLAVAVSVLFLWVRSRKDGTSIKMNLDVLGVGWLVGSSSYVLLLLAVDSTDMILRMIYASLNVVLLVYLFRKRGPLGNRAVINQLVLGCCLGLILLTWGTYGHSKGNLAGEAGNQQQTAEGVKIGIKKGNQAPDFELLTLEGERVKLADFKGKKVLLNFWATWCPPCKAEMPHMEKFSQDYANKDVVVLAVNLTQTEKNPGVVSDFAQKFALTFPIVLDQEGDVANTYQILSYPTSYMLDSQGIIYERFQGAIHYETMEKAIAKMN